MTCRETDKRSSQLGKSDLDLTQENQVPVTNTALVDSVL